MENPKCFYLQKPCIDASGLFAFLSNARGVAVLEDFQHSIMLALGCVLVRPPKQYWIRSW